MTIEAWGVPLLEPATITSPTPQPAKPLVPANPHSCADERSPQTRQEEASGSPTNRKRRHGHGRAQPEHACRREPPARLRLQRRNQAAPRRDEPPSRGSALRRDRKSTRLNSIHTYTPY